MKRRHKYALYALLPVIRGVMISINEILCVDMSKKDRKMLNRAMDQLQSASDKIDKLTENADPKPVDEDAA